MSGISIALVVVAAPVALAGLALTARARLARGSPGEMTPVGDSTTTDPSTGAVRSVQAADLVVARERLAEIWTPMHLERLARSYWRFLAKATLGVVHVHYAPRERAVVLLAPPLKLLTFRAPEYELDGGRGLVRWRIERGLLVARSGRGNGYLQIELHRRPTERPGAACVHIEVEVANFYPAIATRLSRRLYDATQSRVHVILTRAFVRSLARLDLAPSKVGRFAGHARPRAL
ncbi:MAG: hypothetical protein FWD42_09185 [Solirubrobacterales bacterium]|nr:hypothetical protein [Solirubrobacterales bacterium]